ncbi:hypothetical protein [Myroides pelagicus]|uniref:Uncharacterized protein n=1 Tax=Myroides pelagicus TaxID=270914 RepID=A0A7K1GLS9_9FLAO|nr:hypothetical protein [Myroides pelagicus]MEC4114091.1 hypothetical protein [Myroides pelagicus]MTH29184.1 hypothetical protein [Myroides pelagicus]
MNKLSKFIVVVLAIIGSLFISIYWRIGLIDVEVLPMEISDIHVFLSVLFQLELSILFVGILLRLFVVRFQFAIAQVFHLFLLIWFRDYGFCVVLYLTLSFLIATIIFRLLVMYIQFTFYRSQ